MKKLIIIFALIFTTGCASIPKEATSLSIEIGSMINSSKKTHLSLLDEYIKIRRERIDDYMHNVWIPWYIQDFVKQVDLNDEICENIESLESAMVLRDFTEQASLEVAEKRLELNEAVDEIDRTLRKKIKSHYSYLARANRTLTSNLKSFQKNQDFRDEILKQLKMEPEKLPFKKISKKLDKLMELKNDNKKK